MKHNDYCLLCQFLFLQRFVIFFLLLFVKWSVGPPSMFPYLCDLFSSFVNVVCRQTVKNKVNASADFFSRWFCLTLLEKN